MKTNTLLIRALCATLFALVSAPAHAGGEAIDVGDFIAKAEDLSGQNITVKGFVVEVCLHRGCKLFLRDQREDRKSTIRVERTEATPPFDSDIMGETVEIEAVVRTLKIDAAYLDNWEAEVVGTSKVGKPEELGGCSIDDEACEETEEVAAARKQTLAQIAAYRERIASNSKGYLLSVWLECTGLKAQS